MNDTSAQAKLSLASAIGKRLTIRLHDSETGGYRDIVGVLQTSSQLINSRGEIIEFSEDEIAIWREIKALPDRAGTGAPFSLRILELEKLSDATWISDQTLDFGKWRLRLSDGYTMRANSVLPTGGAPFGEPPTAIADAVKSVVQIYREHGLTPIFSIPLPIHDELDKYLESQGWEVKVGAQYLVNEISANEYEKNPDYLCEISNEPSPEWLTLQSDFALNKIMRRYPARYATLRKNEKVIAVGRVATLGTWSVVTRIFVDPSMRSKGIARHLMLQLMAAASQDGATKVGLQVDAENGAALALYQSMGFRVHHSYVYRILNEKMDS